MTRRSNVRVDRFPDLAAQVEILERELVVQRDALQRLKEMARPAQADREPPARTPVRSA